MVWHWMIGEEVLLARVMILSKVELLLFCFSLFNMDCQDMREGSTNIL